MTRLSLIVAVLVSACALAQTKPPASPTPAGLSPAQQEAIRQAAGLPPGTIIVVEETDGGTLEVTQGAQGTGAGWTAKGAELSENADGSPPQANLFGAGDAKGGGINRDIKAKGIEFDLWSNPLLWLGLIGGLGGVVYCLTRKPIPSIRGAVICAGAGAGLIACAVYPGLLVLIAAGVGAWFFIPYLLSEGQRLKAQDEAKRRGEAAEQQRKEYSRHHEALRATLGGLYDPAISTTTRNEILERIAAQADPADLAVIQEIVRADLTLSRVGV